MAKSAPTRALGAAGEERAAAFLQSLGFRIVARNTRADRVEIDLIARRGGLVVFVEVKTRAGCEAGRPEEAVDARKRARLVRGAQAWLSDSRERVTSVRFDVIACLHAPGGEWRIRHWPGAFDENG